MSVDELERLFLDDPEKMWVGRKEDMVLELVKMLYFDYTLETEVLGAARAYRIGYMDLRSRLQHRYLIHRMQAFSGIPGFSATPCVRVYLLTSPRAMPFANTLAPRLFLGSGLGLTWWYTLHVVPLLRPRAVDVPPRPP